jgi:predicted branched-subunit amino acid permease
VAGSTQPLPAFRRGFADALPICFGYFAVGFAVAAAAVANGHPAWSPILQSLTHLSGTSQGAFSHRAIPGPPGGGWELFLLCVGLNLRYVLLALALAQRLPESFGLGRRLLAACAVTDENVALAVSRPFALSFPYLAGVFASSFLGWNAGNALGAVGTSLLPASALAPLGIALYAMFVAIVVPAAKASRATLLCVALAALLNVGLSLLPEGARPSPSLSILAAGVAAAGVSAILAPTAKQETEEHGEHGKGFGAAREPDGKEDAP